MIPYDSSRQEVIARVSRGGCEFATKAINAQAAGFKGLIILDNRNSTTFTKLVASDLNAIPASFIRIPVAFLMLRESKIFDKLLPGQKITFKVLAEELDVPKITKTQKTFISFPSEVNLFHQQESLWDKVRALSPLTLAIIGCAILVALVLVVSLQVCFCSKCCCKRRSSNRVLPDNCGNFNAAHQAFNEGFSTSTHQLNSKLTSLQPSGDVHQIEQMDMCCPVCLEIPLFPKKIFQCSQGHTICDVCLAKIERKCPTCREFWAPSSNLPVRNRMAESMLNNFVGSKNLYASTTSLAEVSVEPYAPSAPPMAYQ